LEYSKERELSRVRWVFWLVLGKNVFDSPLERGKTPSAWGVLVDVGEP